MGSRHFIFAKFRHGCLESVNVRKAVVFFVLLSIEPAYALQDTGMYETLEGNASIGLLTFHITCHMDCFIIGKRRTA